MDRWKLVEEVFLEVSSADPAQREELLRAKCGEDTELIAEVRSLLSHHGQSDSSSSSSAYTAAE